jgi:hypothetical protein
MNEKIETEIGVFPGPAEAETAVRELEANEVPAERIGVVNDPRKAREVVGTRARQLVIPMALVGAVAGIVLLLLVPGQEAYKTGPAGLVPWAIVGAIAGIVVGALLGKTLPARDPEGYQERVGRVEILVTVKVAPAERARVRRILATSGADNLREERTGEAP